jgi:cytochrome b
MGGGMTAAATTSPSTDTRIWDLPTRLFHWALVLLIALLYATGEFEMLDMRWHFWAGYCVLALLAFRVLWGLVGSQTSRFREFVRGPSAVIAYLKSLLTPGAAARVGHNPLGGWSVVILLLCLIVQAVTGLFSSDELEVDGPLVARVSTRTVKLMTRLHHWNQNVLLALIGIHVIAVLLYLLLKHENLIQPMFSGRRAFAAPPTLRFASGWLALALLLLSAAAVTALIWYAGA